MNVRNPYLALAVSAVATFGLLTACAEDRPDDLIRSAKAYIAKNENKAATIQLKSALQKQPDDPEARLLLGKSLLDSGDPVSAEIELRKALALKQPDSAVLPPLARALNLTGQDQKLTQQYALVALDDPTAAADLKTSLAIAYARQGKSEALKGALDAAFAAVPDYAPARRVQARLLADKRDADGALKLLDAILAKAPDDYEAWQLKGDVLLYGKGDIPAANEAHAKALAIRSDFLPARSSQILILLSQRDLPAAKAQIDELKKLAPNHLQTRYLEGELAFLTKDYKTAREIGQQLLKVAPDNVNALRLAGAVEYQIGSLPRAESMLNKALQSAEHSPTRRLLAQSYLRSGDTMKALDTLAPLLDSTDVDAQTLSLAAQAHMKIGDIEKAETYFTQAVALNPGDVKSRTAIAIAQLAKGNTEAGYTQMQELASSDDGTFADLALITAYLRQGKVDAALKAIDVLEKKDPTKPTASDLRGRVHLARKDFAAARKSFEAALKLDPLDFSAASKLAGLDLADGKPGLAKQRLDSLLKAEPNDVQVLLALAELKEKSGGSQDEVRVLLRDAIRLNPTVVAPRLMLIEHHLKNKDIKSALTAAQEGVAAMPNNAEMLDALGRVQLGAGDPNQAISSFNRLAELRPKSPQPLLRLADTYASMKNLDAARHSLERALVIAPRLLPAQRSLISLEMAANRPQAAMAIAKSIQAVPGREAVGALLLGKIEEAQKHWAAAAAAYRTGLQKAPNTELAINLHAALVSGAQPAEANQFEGSWLKGHPDDASFLQYLGDRALAQSQLTKGESHYLSVIRLQPENAVAFNNLAWVSAQLKKPEALGYAEKANALKPDQPAFMDTWAMILLKADQVGKAIEIEKRAVALQPSHPTFRMNLARLYLQAGDKPNAKIELDTLAKLGDKFPGQPEVAKMLNEL